MNDLEALNLLWTSILGTGTGFHAVEYLNGTERRFAWFPAHDWTAFRKFVSAQQWEGEPRISPAPLLHKRSFRLNTEISCFWCRVETGDALARLRRFRPEPTLVLGEGGSVRQVAVWALTRTFAPERVARANKRIAYHLGAKQKHGTTEFATFAPGTVIRTGRKRPLPIVVVGGSGLSVAAGFVGRLKDPPPPADPSQWVKSKRPEAKPAAAIRLEV